ncbi:MAG TPA: hypothetical protein VLX68_04930 [Chitinivibrionales bacterium]|nr:hypothetical protein [Chitinivibrionales bacterium]
MPMHEEYVIFWTAVIFLVLLGLSIVHSVLIIKIRRQEDRRRQLEAELLEKRAHALAQGKQIARELEEVIYKIKVQQEIDDILNRKSSS